MPKKEEYMKKIPVSQIIPAPYNPRVELKPTDPEYIHIKNSIDSFGYLDPIVWNERTGHIVSGHQRFRILCDEGATEIEVRVVSFDEDKEKACNLAMNKAVGLWDEEKLDALLLEMEGTQWDMGEFGFDSLSIDTEEREDKSDDYKEQFQVIIDCPDEDEMEKVYNTLTDQGYTCRVSTL